MKNFQPDYTQILEVLYNRKPGRLPLYEHHIDLGFIAKSIGGVEEPEGSDPDDYETYFRKVVAFWRDSGYDAIDYEAPICNVFPDHGALFGGRPGPIQSRADLERYPFKEIPELFWKTYTPYLDALRKELVPGMKAYGGCGYGIFEAAQDLVGYEYLCTMQYLDPELFRDLFIRIGELYENLWTEMLDRYDDLFVFYRMGDDLGFKNSTLLEPDTIREHVIPQYKTIINRVHRKGKKFLLHSCGNIFPIMEDLIGAGIDAKHSNEDAIAPFERWVSLYADRIGLFGGIDVDILCQQSYDEIYSYVLEKGRNYRATTRGYGIGSGNSIPTYVPEEGFRAMIDAVEKIRKDEE